MCTDTFRAHEMLMKIRDADIKNKMYSEMSEKSPEVWPWQGYELTKYWKKYVKSYDGFSWERFRQNLMPNADENFSTYYIKRNENALEYIYFLLPSGRILLIAVLYEGKLRRWPLAGEEKKEKNRRVRGKKQVKVSRLAGGTH